jgi:hypothetical protein
VVVVSPASRSKKKKEVVVHDNTIDKKRER